MASQGLNVRGQVHDLGAQAAEHCWIGVGRQLHVQRRGWADAVDQAAKAKG